MYSDVKGITGPVILNGKELRDWTMIPIRDPFAIVNMNKMKHFLSEKKWPVPGSIYHGVFIVEELGDTFIQPDSFVRGIISINRHHVGRFDQQQGPQLRLYVPKTFLKLGRNHITITELQGPIKNDAHHVHITFHDQMLWK
ncbi:hypothetical protein Smp_177540 [Schistosoma mansoni]|nr:hypothetical protein Smp_177540 [Schistosoma mansoni]|eukprot:XP_018654358.1 hypothetical protein Smp_177540 [Schistosoma mansoni]